MKKKIPTFKSDEEAEAFVTKADLTDYDLSGAKLVRFELKRKDKSINLRLPGQLLDAVRSRAEKERVPYQCFIRMALEQALQRGLIDEAKYWLEASGRRIGLVGGALAYDPKLSRFPIVGAD